MLHSRLAALGTPVVALQIVKSLDSTEKAAQDARQLALPVVAVGVIIAILYFGRVVFFITSLIAITIAFILEPFVGLLIRVRFPRSLAAFVVCSVALAILYVLGMGAYTQLAAISQDLPIYGQRIGDIVDGVRQKVTSTEERTYQLVVPARQRQAELERQRAQQAAEAAAAKEEQILEDATSRLWWCRPRREPQVEDHTAPIGDFISARLSSLYEAFLMASFIPFLVYFMFELARSHQSQLSAILPRGRSHGGHAQPAGNRGYGAGIRGGEFPVGAAAGTDQLGDVRTDASAVPLAGGAAQRISQPCALCGITAAGDAARPVRAALAPNQVSTYVLVVVSVALLHLIALNLLYPKIVGSRVH